MCAPGCTIKPHQAVGRQLACSSTEHEVLSWGDTSSLQWHQKRIASGTAKGHATCMPCQCQPAAHANDLLPHLTTPTPPPLLPFQGTSCECSIYLQACMHCFSPACDLLPHLTPPPPPPPLTASITQNSGDSCSPRTGPGCSADAQSSLEAQRAAPQGALAPTALQVAVPGGCPWQRGMLQAWTASASHHVLTPEPVSLMWSVGECCQRRSGRWHAVGCYIWDQCAPELPCMSLHSMALMTRLVAICYVWK